MPIPESQLETWSHQGAVTAAQSTHGSIRTALAAGTSLVKEKAYEAYLQGSYKNDTNVRADSDVDLVVQLNSTFEYDLSALSPPESLLFHQNYPGVASYSWLNFRSDVLEALRAYYDETGFARFFLGDSVVSEGDKAISVVRRSGRLPAHVLVCLHYRKYQHFYGAGSERYVHGVVFYTRSTKRRVINFPKPHYDNGVEKNARSRTNGWYKPIVRVFKNARTKLIERRIIQADLAPSYFLECLVYNVPDSMFGQSYQQSVYKTLKHLSSGLISNFVCQNQQMPLFGTTAEQWSEESARETVKALVTLWNDWR
jgi:hypothetical protein